MKDKGLLPVLFVPALILLVPLVANRFVDGFNWGVFDFVFAYGLMAGIGLAYRLLTRRAGSITYRLGAGLALLTAFLLIWITAAVGIIGDENPANLLYGCVLAVAFIGGCLARFAAPGMARALFATAFAQMCVPLIALLVWPADFSPGVAPVFVLNLCFAVMFAGSALLFHAARRDGGSGSAEAG